MEKMLIKDTKELVKFVIELVNAIDTSLEDGKFSLTDVAQFLKPMLSAPNAFNDIKNVSLEIKDLSEVEKVELKEYMKNELKIKSEKIEMVVEHSFSIALELATLTQMLKL
jgi:hypothetical protein